MVFTILDWIVLAAYLLLSLFIGLWVSRGNKNLKEYMFGGGSIPWVAVGISLIATSVSATTFLGAPADVYGDNMTFLMFQIGALLSIVVVGFVFIPKFRSSGINSAYELFEVRFGSKTVRRLAAVFYSLHLLLRTGILLYAPSLVLAQILHVDLKVAIVVSAAVAIFYTWFGGIKAVIWTDVMQFCVFFGGGVLVLVSRMPWAVSARWRPWRARPARPSGGMPRWMFPMRARLSLRASRMLFSRLRFAVVTSSLYNVI